MSRFLLALLRLPPDEARAARLLGRFELRHPGLLVVTPHFRDEPWRVSVAAGTVPGDDRGMILTSNQPSEMLAKLKRLFGCDPGDDPG